MWIALILKHTYSYTHSPERTTIFRSRKKSNTRTLCFDVINFGVGLVRWICSSMLRVCMHFKWNKKRIHFCFVFDAQTSFSLSLYRSFHSFCHSFSFFVLSCSLPYEMFVQRNSVCTQRENERRPSTSAHTHISTLFTIHALKIFTVYSGNNTAGMAGTVKMLNNNTRCDMAK